MYLSRYTLLFKNSTSILLFNTLTRNCVSFDLPINNISKNEIKYLKEHLHVFDSENDDFAYLKFFLNSARYRNPRFSLTLTMTYECNFDCVYCYEKSIRKKGRMTLDIAEKIVDWVELYVKGNPDIQIIDVCFHGGEPFLCYDRILQIAKNLQSKFSDKELYMHIVTNGSMLQGHGKELENVGIKQVQVTLDGLQIVHDSRRKYKNGGGSFNDIIKGCNDLLSSTDNLRLMINTVVDKGNQKDASNLKKFCSETFNSKRVFYYFSDIWLDENNKDIIKSDGSLFNDNSKDFQQFDFCTARGLHNYVIDCFGDIYKCITGAGHTEFKVGSIVDSLYKLQISQSKFLEFESKNEDCENCAYYPLCLSSCMFKQIKQKQDNLCKFKQFENEVKNAIFKFCNYTNVVPAPLEDRKSFIASLN